MSVEKRTGPNGTAWRVRWRERGRARSRTFPRKDAATRFDAAVRLALAEGRPVDEPTGTPTVQEWSEQWLDVLGMRVRSGRIAPRTAEGYESATRLWIVPAIGRVRLDLLSVAHVHGMLEAVQAAGRAPGTARHVRGTLSKMLTDAQRQELVDRNVAQIAEPVTVPKLPPSHFDDGEWARIVAGLDGHRHGLLWLFIAATGLRSSEAFGLRWADVDLDDGTYQVSGGVHRVSAAAARVAPTGVVRAPRPKNAASGRRTPLSTVAVELLEAQRRRQVADRLAAPVWHDEDVVWHSRVGTPLNRRNVGRAWEQHLEAVGVPYRRDGRPGRGMHELRRTWATRAREAGVDVETVTALGRWSSPQMLLTTYRATPADRLRAGAEQAAGRDG